MSSNSPASELSKNGYMFYDHRCVQEENKVAKNSWVYGTNRNSSNSRNSMGRNKNYLLNEEKEIRGEIVQ